jgi:hypothetical protein
MESDGSLSADEETEVQKLGSCLNKQFTRKIVEYRNQYEQCLTQLPLGGSQFMKFFPDKIKGRVCSEFVPIDDLFIPFYATNFYDAERVTHRQYVSRSLFEERIENSMYRDVSFLDAIDIDRSSAATANDKIEGKEESGYNEDGVRQVYETYTWLSLSDDEISSGVRAPYIVTIDKYEQKVLSIYRNWEEQDPTRQKLDWIVEEAFIPWRGAYAVGLPHLIGGLSAAATGSLRALLDSAHINNAPTLLKLKNARITPQTQQVAVTQIAEIEGPVGIDDIRKFLMTMPFNAPSPVLFQLLGWLTDAAKGVVSTASEKIADATSNTPVGTTQALIEQGSIIFSSIHARLHHSQAKSFEIVLRILRQYFPQELMEYEINPQTVTLKNIHPVSDPHIFSEAQRYAQLQGAMQLAAAKPEMYNEHELHRSMLTLMKIRNVDRFLPPPPLPPKPLDPAGEMVSWVQNKPVIVTPEQDHFSHIVVHMNYLRDPLYGRNPVMIPITAKIMDHLRDHLGYYFAMRMMTQAQQVMMEAQQANATLQQQGLIPGPMPHPDNVMAQTSGAILAKDSEVAQEAVELLEDIAEFIRINGPQDANMAAVKMQAQLEKAETERKAEKDRMDAMLKMATQEQKAELDALAREADERKAIFDARMKEQELAMKQRTDEMNASVNLLKNEQDNMQKQMTELAKNEDDNRTKMLIETMKAGFTQISEKETNRDDTVQSKQLESLMKQVQEAQNDQKLGTIMQGLQEAINITRAPRVTIPVRNAEGDLVGARSELEQE